MLISILVMSIMGLLFGLGLAFASELFRVNVDPRIERILSALPGTNCGACGKPGCTAMAEAIVKGDASLTSCPAGGERTYAKIADILGVERGTATKKVARVRCGGGKNAKDKYAYQGVNTCRAAAIVAGGQKLCSFGCLGFGDCVKACVFDAIHIGEDGVPVVNPQKCTACGRCVEACPKYIISLEDAREKYYVKCLSHDKSGFVKEACKTGCIACRICEKISKGVFKVEDNLSSLDYSKLKDTSVLDLCVEKCPTGCIAK